MEEHEKKPWGNREKGCGLPIGCQPNATKPRRMDEDVLQAVADTRFPFSVRLTLRLIVTDLRKQGKQPDTLPQ